MGYTLNTGPLHIRPTGPSVGESGNNLRDSFRKQCVDVYVEPPFNPGLGLNKALGLSGSIVPEHVATTEESTHLYIEVQCVNSSNEQRIAKVLDRLEGYLNPNGTKLHEITVASFRSNIL